MGGMTRRGFLRATAAACGALAITPPGFARPPVAPARLFEWRTELFDHCNQLGVAASMIGPDGIKCRHAVRVQIKDSSHARNGLDLAQCYPAEYREAQDALWMWSERKRMQWAA